MENTKTKIYKSSWLVNKDLEIADATEDAPLVRVSFHNNFKKLTIEERASIIIQIAKILKNNGYSD